MIGSRDGGQAILPVRIGQVVILMKRAAGRPKDLIEVEILAAVREEIESE
jgi:hypothetical protein